MSNFVPTDLPGLDPDLVQESTDVLADLAHEGKYDLYLFDSAILGYSKMTPSVHGPLCTFFTVNPAQYKQGLMPRDHFKSSCITIGGNLQKAVRDPNKRIHIKNERDDNASRFLSAMQTHCLSNQLFRSLYGQYIPKDTRKVRWNANEMDMEGRSGIFPEPTISCSGARTATTSNHYTDLTWDDPISDEAAKSEIVMEDTWTRMKSSINLLAEPEESEMWVVGTNWSHNDVYIRWMKHFGQYTAKLARGAIENGKPIFPELISIERLDMLRAADPYLFSCNYMNNPRNSDVQNFDIRALKRWKYTNDEYKDEIVVYDAGTMEVLATCDVDKLDITVTVDLAISEKLTSDRNAIVVQGIEPSRGYCIVLEAWAERCTPGRVIDRLFEINAQWHPRKIGIESVAYQKAFSWFLQEAATAAGVWLPIVPIKALGKKEIRVSGLQPMVRTGRCAIHSTHQLLLAEIDEWPLGEHDDLIDAWSMQLQIANHWFSPERIAKLKAAENKMLRKHGIVPEDELDETEKEVMAKVRALTHTGRWGRFSHTILNN